jgi:hypothetical protein
VRHVASNEKSEQCLESTGSEYVEYRKSIIPEFDTSSPLMMNTINIYARGIASDKDIRYLSEYE